MGKNKGFVFLSIGCILLLVACGWYAYNIIEDKNAGQYAAEILHEFNEAQNEKTDKNTYRICDIDLSIDFNITDCTIFTLTKSEYQNEIKKN